VFEAFKLLHLANKLDPQDEKQELTQHLAELRSRIIRAGLYALTGMVLMYAAFHPIFAYFMRPITGALKELRAHSVDGNTINGMIVFHSFFEPFFLRLQLSLIAGLIVAAPFVLLEAYGFVLPALTPIERKSVRLIAPFSVLLFAAGGSLAFWIMPAGIHWFLLYLNDFPDAILLQDPQDYILFLVKMILAFGLVFQLPVLMMGLGKVGIIRSTMLIKYWRYIVVGITIAAMLITPSNDPISMLVMAVPLVILFFGSIGLVKMVEPKA
jgi:sec-independent protein translocase protein TatC